MRKYVSIGLIFAAGAALGFVWRPWYDAGNGLTVEGYDPTDYARTAAYIKRDHVKKDVKDRDLFYGSLNGMLLSLDDPHSFLLDPETAKLADSRMQGFSGIGAQLDGKDGKVVVKETIEDSPAHGKLMPGDVIVAVDDVATDGRSMADVISGIRGPKGETVQIKVVRGTGTPPVTIPLVRADIDAVAVKLDFKAAGTRKIAHIRLSQFSEDALAQFLIAVAQARGRGAEGIILDLRGNPGGLVMSARDIACLWTGRATIALMERRGTPPESVTCAKAFTQPLIALPTIVLVDEHSASASEIVAGALQDHQKARVIGRKTYGKGSGQELITYPSGAELRLTTFLWKTPLGRSINKAGIMPDETIEGDALPRALEILSQ